MVGIKIQKTFCDRDERIRTAEETYLWLNGLEIVTADQFAEGIAGQIGRGMAAKYGCLIMRHNLWEDVISMALSENDVLAFRSSWAINWAYFHSHESMMPYVDLFVETYLRSTNGSVHRCFSKIFYDMLCRGTIVLSDEQTSLVSEKCFDLLINEDTKPAVKVWCADILLKLSSRVEWVAENLAATLRYQLETAPTPALLSHYAKILKKMKL